MRSEMAATRENVLAEITRYVETNKRRAPAKAIAEVVGDTIPNVKAIVKGLVEEGVIESSRGRNGGAKLVGAQAEAVAEAPVNDDVAAQFAALVAQIDADAAAIEAQAEVA